MNESPPPIKPRSLRYAVTLNLMLPGAGQLYLGQWRFGGLLVAMFLVCFASMIAIFLHGYVQYLGLVGSGDVFEPNVIETLTTIFHFRWLVGLLVSSLVVLAVSMVGLAIASRHVNAQKDL